MKTRRALTKDVHHEEAAVIGHADEEPAEGEVPQPRRVDAGHATDAAD